MTQHLAPVWTHLTTFRPVRGEGATLVDAEGRRLLDFTSGIGVTNTGHAHPRVVAAVREQAEKLLFAQINCVVSPLAEALAETLAEVTPEGIDRFFLTNSGAEAVEGAVKLARHATGRPNVIVFQGSFHGRTAQAMAMTTSKTVYRHRYAPLPAGVVVAPFPTPYRWGWSEDEAVRHCLAELELILKGQSAPDETAAMVLEPVLGEGGYLPAPPAFLRGLRELCDRHGILLVLDEVQSGFGRTGAMFRCDALGVRPDVLVMAKGLASGLPVAAIGAPAALMERWEPGTHGGTYGGGSLVALAAARATVETIRDEGLPARAAAMGERLSDGLRRLQDEHPDIGEVRGPGLMVGVEFSAEDRRPDPARAAAVQRACLDAGLLLLTCGPAGNVIRFIPPLVVGPEEIDRGLELVAGALREAPRAQPA